MSQPYFEDIDVGDEIEDEWLATRAQVLEYIDLEPGGPSEDAQGRFTDPVRAKKLGFERPIVPGALSMSVLTRLVTDWMGPDGHLESIDINFRRPVLQEDGLRTIGLIIDAEPAESGGRVRIDVYFENDRGERPLQGVAVVRLPSREGAQADG